MHDFLVGSPEFKEVEMPYKMAVGERDQLFDNGMKKYFHAKSDQPTHVLDVIGKLTETRIIQ